MDVARTQHGIDIRMQHMGGRVRFERGVAALPPFAQAATHAIEIYRRLRVLQMRRKQTKAPLEYRRRSGDARLRERRRRDAALRRKTRMQKLRLRPVEIGRASCRERV